MSGNSFGIQFLYGSKLPNTLFGTCFAYAYVQDSVALVAFCLTTFLHVPKQSHLTFRVFVPDSEHVGFSPSLQVASCDCGIVGPHAPHEPVTHVPRPSLTVDEHSGSRTLQVAPDHPTSQTQSSVKSLISICE